MSQSEFGFVILASTLVTLTTYVACVEHPIGTTEAPEFSLRDDAPAHPKVIGIERVFADISEQVPEFAGFHFSQTGPLVVSLTDLAKTEQVRPHLDALRANRRRNGLRVASQYRAVEYTFTELRAWRDRVAGLLLEVPQAVFVDLDEVANRVVVGLTHLEAESEVRGLAGRLEVPDGALTFVRHSRFVPSVGRMERELRAVSHTLQQHQDSMILGGVQVRHKESDGSFGTCSAWIGVRQGSDSMYITASHCGEFATLEGSGTLHQHLTADSHKIGEEDTDPTSTCTVPSFATHNPGSTDCRWADASMYQATDLDRFTQGWIAKTTSSNGSKTIVDNEIIVITGEIPRPIIDGPAWLRVGEEVHKIGQAGGWTIGDVVGTCFLIFNWPVTEIDYTLRCQDLAVYDVSSGDSGGPVFVDQGGSWDIIGLHIGQDTLVGIDTAFFSRMENIEEDLGAVVTMGIPILESINPRGVERVGGGQK